jgi:hypothetical protein
MSVVNIAFVILHATGNNCCHDEYKSKKVILKLNDETEETNDRIHLNQ